MGEYEIAQQCLARAKRLSPNVAKQCMISATIAEMHDKMVSYPFFCCFIRLLMITFTTLQYCQIQLHTQSLISAAWLTSTGEYDSRCVRAERSAQSHGAAIWKGGTTLCCIPPSALFPPVLLACNTKTFYISKSPKCFCSRSKLDWNTDISWSNWYRLHLHNFRTRRLLRRKVEWRFS